MTTEFFRLLQSNLRHFLDTQIVNFILITLIVLSIFTISFEITDNISNKIVLNNQHIRSYSTFSMINDIILIIFAIELITRIIAYGFSFFRSPWNIFDFIIIGLALTTFQEHSNIQIIRAFRMFFIFRTITIFPIFQHLLSALAIAVPKMAATLLILAFSVYIFSIIGVILY